MIAAEYGLRSRLGWREWAILGTGEQVRTLLAYTGSTKDGSTNRLFAATSSGIWDVSASGDQEGHGTAPEMVVPFPLQNEDSGWGSFLVMATAAGHFGLYLDEANGYYVYSENGGTWTKVVPAATEAWAPTTDYALGDARSNGGLTYHCIAPGTSAGADGPSGTGSAIVDGGAVWAWAPAVAGVDPGALVQAIVWKNRVVAVERDSGRGWYLDVGALYGTAHPIYFGNRFQRGGDLRCVASWTGDGGAGIDDRLVAISGAGDVVIYEGTDPSQAATFGLKGVWFVGAVPAGRRLTTDLGGDLAVMSSLGILPLSRLVIGNVLYDRSQYQTFQIANLFNQQIAATSSLRGWSMRLHPQDSCLMVLSPTAEGEPTSQLVMSLTTKGWHRYRDLPMGVSAEPWNGTLFFGTEDGRVCANDGYVDGVLLADPDSYAAIGWSLLTAYSNLGSPVLKRLQWIDVEVLSQAGAVPVQAEARFDFDLAEASPPSAIAAKGGSAWDAGAWDDARWGGGYTPQRQRFGASGVGREVALAVRGLATSRMTLVGMDVGYDAGGTRFGGSGGGTARPGSSAPTGGGLDGVIS